LFRRGGRGLSRRPARTLCPLDVNYVKVHTRITDQVAVTSVDQEFYNPNPARLEGTFVFPIPKGAQINKFTMEIDGKQVEAELLPADKARRIYEDIVRRLKDPALLEYAGRDVFKVRIFPIEPNSKKRITISYTELLKADDGLVSYVLPLNTEKFSAKPIRNVSVKVDLESKRPLKSIYSPSHSVEVKRHGPDRATAGYEATDVHPDADFALYFAPEKDEIGVNLLTYRKSDEDGYFLLLASPGVDVKEKQVVMKDIAFVLDTSGSMAGKKLEQARRRCCSASRTSTTATASRSSASRPRWSRCSISLSRPQDRTAPRPTISSKTSSPWAARRLTTRCARRWHCGPAARTAPSS